MTEETPSQTNSEVNPPVRESTSVLSKIKEKFTEAKEKVSNWIAYKTLKVREYFGLVDKESLDKLLDMDFKGELQDNEPISGVFDPQAELNRIKALPTNDEKRAELPEYKAKLARQRIGLANCRIFVERLIEHDNDVPKDKLMGWVDKFGEKYGFSDTQKQTSENLIDRYYQERSRTVEFRSQYNDDKTLVEALTHMEFPGSKFKVETRAMAIEVTANDRDAMRIFYQHPLGSTPKDKKSYAGFASQSSHVDPILFTVINKDLSDSHVRPHEDEHEKYKLFRAEFNRNRSQSERDRAFREYDDEADPTIKQGLMKQYLRLELEDALDRAQDEVIAMKKDKESKYYKNFYAKDRNVYDYLAPIRDFPYRKNDLIWQAAANKILVGDYEKILKRATESFDTLEKGAGLTRDETIAMFTDKPLVEWPMVTRRLLEEMKNK